MKLHKLEIFVYDFNEYDTQSIIDLVESNRDAIIKVKKVDSVEIKNWSDDHELNSRSATHEQFLKYFLTPDIDYGG